jgi:hypothetical protein
VRALLADDAMVDHFESRFDIPLPQPQFEVDVPYFGGLEHLRCVPHKRLNQDSVVLAAQVTISVLIIEPC